MSIINLPAQRTDAWRIFSQLKHDFHNWAREESGLTVSDVEVGTDEWVRSIVSKSLTMGKVNANGSKQASTKLRAGRLSKVQSGELKFVAADSELSKALATIGDIRAQFELQLVEIQKRDDEFKTKEKEFLDQRLPLPMKRQIVDAINDACSSHARNNGNRELLTAQDLGSNSTIRTFLSKDLGYWRSYLLAQAKQTQQQLSFASWKTSNIRGLHSATLADRYLVEIFRRIQENRTSDPRNDYLTELDKSLFESYRGYYQIANIFYAGDLSKAFINISSITKMLGMKIPKHWKNFRGNTQQFTALKTTLQNLGSRIDGIDGYLRFAEQLFYGDMNKAFTNISAVAHMTGQPMPKNWQQYQGTTQQFIAVRSMLENPDFMLDGLDGYRQIADENFQGAMFKTYLAVSAVAHMTGQPMPKSWQAFNGTTQQFNEIKEELSDGDKPLDGLEAFMRVAQRYFKSDMNKAFTNISAVAHMTGQPMPEGWQAFRGTVQEFVSLKGAIENSNRALDGLEGYIQFAIDECNGDMQIAFKNMSAVTNMAGIEMPEGWRLFEGTSQQLRAVRSMLENPNGTLDGLDGYMDFADAEHNRNLATAFKNVSAVAHMTGQPMPEGWQVFRGTTAQLKALHKLMLGSKNNLAGFEGLLKIADEHFQSDMLKAYANATALTSLTRIEMPEGWRAFTGDTTSARKIAAAIRKMDEQTLLLDFAEKPTTINRQNFRAIATMLGRELPMHQGFRQTR